MIVRGAAVPSGGATGLSICFSAGALEVMIFDQKGLMAGVGLQGSKITKLNR